FPAAFAPVSLAPADAAEAALSPPAAVSGRATMPAPALVTAAAIPEAPAGTPAVAPDLHIAPLHSQGQNSGPGWLAAMFALWIAVAGLGLARLGHQGIRLRRLLASRRPVIAGPICSAFNRVAGTEGARVRLSVSPVLSVPVAFGLWRKEICVPVRARDLSPEALDALIAHELAHILRRDPLWRIAAAAAVRGLFFQPLNIIARRNLDSLAEDCCDDWAASRTGRPLALARCLADVAAWLPATTGRRLLIPAMAERRSGLVRRVHRLVDHDIRAADTRPRVLWVVLAAAVALVALAPGASAKPEPAPAQSKPAKAAKAPAPSKPAKAPAPSKPSKAAPAPRPEASPPPPARVGPPAAPESRLAPKDRSRTRPPAHPRMPSPEPRPEPGHAAPADPHNGQFSALECVRCHQPASPPSPGAPPTGWPSVPAIRWPKNQPPQPPQWKQWFQDHAGPNASPAPGANPQPWHKYWRQYRDAMRDEQIDRALRNLPDERAIREQVESALRNIPDRAALREQIERSLRNIPDRAALREQIEQSLRNIPDRAALREQIERALRNAPRRQP
ncbi:MAG TPA: M56 family metallopeptidase, partial [Kofleriaceae bacterium]|nr:M56 family metallopeptidase [Kofleriaceae bacterium]